MIQEIIALLIVAVAVLYAVRGMVTFFKNFAENKVCSCSTCPAKNMLKDIKKKQ
ncbi:MAG: hypothetical protein ACLFNL_01800 [Bacteroidales bacterium]